MQHDYNQSAIMRGSEERIGMNKLIQLGTLVGGVWDKRYESDCRVYSPCGICPTLHGYMGGGTETKILENAENIKDNELIIKVAK